jgi:hypothetical protein
MSRHEEPTEADPLDTTRPISLASREHDLKLATEFFDAVLSGMKSFELRRNDRNFAVGDVLVLREWHQNGYTGRSCRAVVTYMTDGLRVGALQPGFVCMSIVVVRAP